MALACLEELRDNPFLAVGAAYRTTTKRRAGFTEEKHALYRDLVRQWDEEHRRTRDFAFVSMDGRADPAYIDAHRALKLDTRHVIEDPMFHDSRRSQWTQIADIVAYVAHVHVNPHPGNEFAWEWYRTYLAARDPMAEPFALNRSP